MSRALLLVAALALVVPAALAQCSVSDCASCGNDDDGWCIQCDAGFYKDGGSCTACDTAATKGCSAGEYFAQNAPCSGSTNQDYSTCNSCAGNDDDDDASCGGNQVFVNNFDQCDGTTTSDPSTCVDCDASCAGCTAAGAGNCLDCALGYYRQSAGTCVACTTPSCSGNTYAVTCDVTHPGQDGECRDCDAACNGCSGPGADECTNCAADHYMAPGRVCTACSHNCGAGEFEIACAGREDTQCTACHSSCNLEFGCTGGLASDCNVCGAGYFANAAGVCTMCSTPSCGAQEFEVACTPTSDAVCSACDASCDGCTAAGASACTACESLHFLDGGSCTACSLSRDCEANEYRAGCSGEDNWSCAACDATCDTCTGPADTECTSCALGHVRRTTDNKCVVGTGTELRIAGQEVQTIKVEDETDSKSGSRESIVVLALVGLVMFGAFMMWSLSGSTEATAAKKKDAGAAEAGEAA